MSLLRRRSLGVAVALVLGSGCSSESPVPPPAPTSSAAPDELAPGELAEGATIAFGIRLPAALEVDQLSTNHARARGSAPLEAVTNYIRDRVEGGNVVTGPVKTIFDDIK